MIDRFPSCSSSGIFCARNNSFLTVALVNDRRASRQKVSLVIKDDFNLCILSGMAYWQQRRGRGEKLRCLGTLLIRVVKILHPAHISFPIRLVRSLPAESFGVCQKFSCPSL